MENRNELDLLFQQNLVCSTLLFYKEANSDFTGNLLENLIVGTWNLKMAGTKTLHHFKHYLLTYLMLLMYQ